jgi:hypothetical protein
MQGHQPAAIQRSEQLAVLPTEGEPYRLTIGPRSGLEVSGRLQNEADVDSLIRALSAWKVLLQPISNTQPDKPMSSSRKRLWIRCWSEAAN